MKKYDYFIAVPMSSLTPEEYTDFKTMLQSVCAALEASGKHIFCAPFVGEKVNFEQPRDAYIMDTEALRHTDTFIMIMPKPAFTGAIYEAGYADALGLPMYWFVQSDEALVYMTREADKAAPGRIHICKYSDMAEIPARLFELTAARAA